MIIFICKTFVDNKYLPLILEKCQTCSSKFDGDESFVYIEEGFPITVVTIEGESLYTFIWIILAPMNHAPFHRIYSSAYSLAFLLVWGEKGKPL